jgi:hypothetical protein
VYTLQANQQNVMLTATISFAAASDTASTNSTRDD